MQVMAWTTWYLFGSGLTDMSYPMESKNLGTQKAQRAQSVCLDRSHLTYLSSTQNDAFVSFPHLRIALAQGGPMWMDHNSNVPRLLNCMKHAMRTTAELVQSYLVQQMDNLSHSVARRPTSLHGISGIWDHGQW